MDEARFKASIGALLLAITLLLSLLLSRAPGSPDVPLWIKWMAIVHEKGLVQGYATIVENFPRGLTDGLPSEFGSGEYPPLCYLILQVVSRLGASAGLAPLLSLKLALLAFHWSTALLVLAATRSTMVYRPRFARHRIAAYAARAAVESWSRLTASGGRNPWRSTSQVAL
jgi:hypothetical protein